MNWQAVTFDWNQVRSFLAVLEEGSQAGAARALGLTQPTIGRQIMLLEQALGVTLFERVGRGLVLTGAGQELGAHVREMGAVASRLSLRASGQSQDIAGRVSLTASDMLSAFFLPRAVQHLRRVAPALEIEILSANDVRNLQDREADIAIRHVRPQDPDLIARLVRETRAVLVASGSLLRREGRPRSVSDLARLPFVGFDPVDRLIATLNHAGLTLDRGNFPVSTNSGIAMGELVALGIGVGVAPEDFVSHWPGVERLDIAGFTPITVPFWLTTHRELHTARRIRLVFDVLADLLQQPNAPGRADAIGPGALAAPGVLDSLTARP
ncbi:MAG: LysR family transcriptional regulator [Alphaproteobacteria bacterium]|nr:LysR family transcriptional regulator [Alphaproteobacteria bacterium]